MFPISDIEKIIAKITAIHKSQPNIVLLGARTIKIVGDTHGQFQDLLYIFDTFGLPSDDNPYLFNGDFVDRGSQGLEIVLTLFALKIANGTGIYLNRGNHETDLMNRPYGFEKECAAKLTGTAFRLFSQVFETLPVGHIIGNAVFIVHGGLFGDDSVKVEDIQKMSRFGQPPADGPMNDILWSDPMNQNGHAPSPRGATQTFGPDVTDHFLTANGLQLLIRSHQLQDAGYLVQHAGKCITVFSAPNYIGRMQNKGAIVVLKFEDDGALKDPEFLQFSAQPIPAAYPPMKFANLALLC
jgi:serine/threonine-protein phosphatase 5